MISTRRQSRYLADGENVVMEVRRHGAVLIGPVVEAGAVVAGAALLGWVLTPASGSDVVDVVLGVVTLGVVARALWRAWEWWVDRIVVTDRRIFLASGILTRKVASMPLAKVTDMTYRRSVLGRLLGYGELIVESAGQRQALGHIDHLPRPDRFYRTVATLVTSGYRPARSRGRDDEDTGPLPRIVV